MAKSPDKPFLRSVDRFGNATYLGLLFVTLTAASAAAQTVERVIDGDTVVVATIGSVRLIGIDTPEMTAARPEVLEMAREARAFLLGLIGGRTVRLEYDQQRRDKYNRTLAYLYLPDGRFVNAEIIKQGYSHAYTQNPFRYMQDFRAYEREARSAGRGLWGSSAAALLAVTPAPLALAAVETYTATVYVTRTGTKYHRAGCRSLARSQIPIQLAEAAAKYGPCSICKPPTAEQALGSSPPGAPSVTPRSANPPPVSSGRCQAITKRGTQCSRKAQPGRNYCWQR